MDRITRTVPDKLLMSIRAIFVKSKKAGNRIWKTIKNVKNVMSKRNTVLKNIVNNPRKDGCVSFNIQQTEIRDEKLWLQQTHEDRLQWKKQVKLKEIGKLSQVKKPIYVGQL